MRNKIYIIIGLICLLVSCIEEADINNAVPTPGKEVKLSADLRTPQTRTLYGSEADDNTAVKVNWVNGDIISVYGTDCAVKQANYSVFVNKDATPNGDGQNFADDLMKIGAAGVQWGSEPESDFYAVYPASTGDIASDGTSVVVPMTVETQQYNRFEVNGKIIQGIPYDSDSQGLGMKNAIMYAYTRAQATKEGKPQDVNLRFIPYSTVLKFSIPSWYGDTTNDLETNQTGQSIIINSITLTAPENIAGDFLLTLTKTEVKENGTVNYSATPLASEGNSKVITINPSSQLKWEFGYSLEFNVFVIPINDLILTKEWTVSVNISDGTSKTFSLAPKLTEADGANGKYNPAELVAGKIHKINVPSGFPVPAVWTYQPEAWIKDVPRNIYIADLSMPGAWYAGDLKNYQSSATLNQLYSAGVRAFHIDCLMCPDDASGGRFSGVKEIGERKLICAGTQSASGALSLNYTQGTYVEEVLGQISGLVRDDEYVVVVLSIAEKPQTWSIGSLQTLTIGSVNPDEVIPAITTMLNSNGKSWNVFGYRDKDRLTDENGNLLKDEKDNYIYKTVNSNTTLNEVLKSMIVKINTNTTSLSSYTFPSASLVSFASMASDTDYNTNSDNIDNLAYNYFASMQQAPLYWGNTSTGLTYYYHQAQKTRTSTTESASSDNTIPTLKDRCEAITNIVQSSKEIYGKQTHDAWFQIATGGYNSSDADDKSTITSHLNDHLLELINEKTAEDASPVGIVLMNDCLDYTTLIKAIIDLNGKYYLNRDKLQQSWPPTDGDGVDEGGM